VKTKKTDNEYKYKQDYLDDLEVHDNYVTDFDAYEAMLIGQVYDSVSKSVSSSSITDSYAATLAIERAARVVGKTPDGTVEAAAKKDSGKASFMDILRQKWIYPNANAQRPFFEKLRLWQLYSSVYGYMPMFYDWNVANNGYVGPDCWLWNPRNLIPQQGRVSIADMDYVTALSWVGKNTLKGWLDAPEDAGWDEAVLKELIELSGKESTGPDSLRDTNTERTRVTSNVKKGIQIATRYEAGEDGHWVTFAPDHGCKVLRDIPNPHKNGLIPFVIKYSQPLFDSFYGMGDFQRAKPLQFARDGLTNFYFHGIKMNLLPPIVANANGIIKHTLDYRPGGVIMETIPNSVRRLETSTAGLNTYQAAQSQLTGSLLSLYGTQNASIPGSEALNPSQGKTPAAISMYSGKEATRDGQERAQLEQAIEQLTDGFFSLVSNIGTETIPVNLFSEDIEEIVRQGHTDLLDLVQPSEDGQVGTLMINPEQLRGADYRFNINPGSTAEISKEKQRNDLFEFIGAVGKFQNILKDDQSVKIEWGKMFDRFEELSDIKGAGEFITIISPEELQAQQQQQMEMEAQANAQAQAQAQQQQAASTPQGISVRGNMFRDPDIAAAAQAIDGA
jgi:hypothetical protein